MNKTLFGIAVAAGVAAAVLTLYVIGHPYIPVDATVERDVQGTNWGPLIYAFRFFSWIGDAKGLVVELVIFILIVLFNRHSWIFAAGATLSGGWYEAVVTLVHRPRPKVPTVIQVLEHPGASSYPSGHTIFVMTVVVVLMVCLGRRFLPVWGQVAGWSIAALLVLANAIGRVYTGAHWPTDVLGGILIAVFWLGLLGSIRRVSDSRQLRRKSLVEGVRQTAAG
jgi:membrane-associated phospholipid phosphatase